MRPVNLIPPEEQRSKAPIRTGPIAYLLVGTLALALGAVTMLVLTDNKISDNQSKITQLKQQDVAAKAQADELAPFANFANVANQRMATVKSLANSRFDWPRVMRELARVIPKDVWLTNLGGTVSSSVSVQSASSAGAGAAGNTSISGPSLQLSGCAAGQDSVARFLAALRDIDGVTRVGLSSSDLPTTSTSGSSSASPSGSTGATSSDCSERNFLAKFQIVAAFDAVPPPQVPGSSPSTSTAATPGGSAPATPAASTSTPSAGD